MYVKAFKGKVKKLVLIGQTANKIAQTCDKYGFKDYVFANDLKEVVDICAASADKGDAVLLSPACASWGMFDNYEQRGDMFKQYVNELLLWQRNEEKERMDSILITVFCLCLYSL